MPALTAIPHFTWISPNVAPQAVLLCVHGLGLYGGSFASLGEKLSRQGIATYALDVRGFGSWQKHEQLHCVLDFKTCLQDIREAIRELKVRHPGLPVFLMGESLGGAIASTAVADTPDLVEGLILSAPARVIYEHNKEVVQIAFSALTGLGKPVCISSVVFKHAPQVVTWQQSDPMIRLNYTVAELLHLVHFLRNSFNKIRRLPNIPVLVVQGHSDTLITTTSTLKLFERLPCSDKQLVVLGSSGHLIFQAPDVTPRSIMMVRDWIREHTAAQLHGQDGKHARKRAG